jgi:uncharacterized membrane protein (UPF0182 family)
VFTTQLVAHVVLFVLAALVVGGLIGTNMWVALRLRPRQRTRGSSQVLDRYRDLLENNRVAAVIIPSAVFGVMAGMSMSTQVMPVLAWLNRKPSGIVDPYFGLDTTFYMIDYPVLRLVLSLLMSGLAFGLVAAAAVHFAVGNIVISRERRGVGAPRVARVHLSIVAAVILLVFGLQCLVDRFGLLLQQGSLFTGLQYTDGKRPHDRATRAGRDLVHRGRLVRRQRVREPDDPAGRRGGADARDEPHPQHDLPGRGADVPGAAERA